MLAVAFVSPALAHPHIFIDARAAIVFDASGAVTAIRHEWTFDEAFSAWQTQGLDLDGDGVTSTAEMAELAADTMAGLAEYHFYTFAGEGEGAIDFVATGDATFENHDGRTVLRFSVRPEQPYRIGTELELAVNDPEYYVAITFAAASVITLENAPTGCGVRLEPPRELQPELADMLYALPPEVTELPPDLAAALRGVQGAILINCGGPDTAANAADAVAVLAAPSATPFGGPPPEPGFTLPRIGALGWLAEQQRGFYAALTAALGRLKADWTAFWVLGGLSFLYGIFHAAGPGHGKVVISSYMLANERQVRHGIWLSFLSATLQSAVAVLFVGIAAGVLNLTGSAMSDAANWIGIASYALIALLGLWLIARKLLGWGHAHDRPNLAATAHGHLHDEGHGHHHDHAHEHDGHEHEEHGHHAHIVMPEATGGNWREQAAVVVSVGLRPCSGALVVLAFAYSQGVMAAGIAAVFLMGLGVAITVGVLASLAVGAKGLARRIGGLQSGIAGTVVWWLELLAAVGVFWFGVVLVLAGL